MMISFSFLTTMMGRHRAAWSPLTVVPSGEGAGGTRESPYGDADLKSFATAAVNVRRITDAYVERMVAAKSEKEKKELEQRASGDMVQAVRKEGLSVTQYQDIANRVQTDSDLAERVKQKLREVA